MSGVHNLIFFHQGNDGCNPGSPDCRIHNRYFIRPVLHSLLTITIVMFCGQNALAATEYRSAAFIQSNTLRFAPIILNNRKDSFEQFIKSSSKKTAYTDLKLTHKRKSSKVNIKTHLNAKYIDKSVETIDGKQAMKINKLYLDASIPKYFVSARLGRQSFNMAGTPYPVDGLALSYKLFKQQKINLLAGYPQSEPEAVEINTDKSLYGISTESKRFAKYWKTDAYAYEQKVLGITDMQVMGARINFVHKKHKAMLQMDMDTTTREPLSTNLAYQWTPGKHHYFKLALDYRKPKAAMGQSVTALNELLKTMSTEEIQFLKEDDTAVYRSGSLSWGKPLMSKFFLKSEVSASSLTRLLDGNRKRYDAYFLYDLEISADNVFKKKDKSSLSLRYLDHNATQLISLSFKNRLPVKPYWHADFLLEAYWQKTNGQTQALKYNPLIKLQYNKKDKNKLDFDIGIVRLDHINQPELTNSNDLFFSITYSKKL